MGNRCFILKITKPEQNMNKKSNKSAYSFIYKMRIQKALAYRFDVFANIIFQCIVMFATAFFWKAIYSGYDSVQGADRKSVV